MNYCVEIDTRMRYARKLFIVLGILGMHTWLRNGLNAFSDEVENASNGHDCEPALTRLRGHKKKKRETFYS